MQRPTFIARASLGQPTDGGFLTDGESCCPYGYLGSAVADVRAQLQSADVSPRDAVVLECANTLASALTLLCLVEDGYPCVLWPDADRATPSPAFCRYRLRAFVDGGDSAPLSGCRPRIEVQKNAGWNGRHGGVDGLLYLRTSGSTGRPRLAAHSWTKLVDNATACVERFELRAEDRVAVPVPIAHMYGLGAAFLPALLAGASVDLQGDAQVLRYLAREQDFTPSVAYLTPSFCEALLAVRKSPRAYRATVSAGDRLPSEVFLRYEERHGTLLNLYGCTELGAIAACHPKDTREVRSATVGRLMPGVQLCPDATNAAAVTGENRIELRFRHAHGFEGYADDDGVPQIRDGSAHDNGFVTHDVGRMRADGALQVLGRSDHQVNRDGRLVALTDIEVALQGITGIERAAVITSGRTRRGPGLIALCVTEMRGAPTARELRRACLDVLPKHAIPDEFVLVPELPLLPSGKVDRLSISARYAQHAAASIEAPQ